MFFCWQKLFLNFTFVQVRGPTSPMARGSRWRVWMWPWGCSCLQVRPRYIHIILYHIDNIIYQIKAILLKSDKEICYFRSRGSNIRNTGGNRQVWKPFFFCFCHFCCCCQVPCWWIQTENQLLLPSTKHFLSINSWFLVLNLKIFWPPQKVVHLAALLHHIGVRYTWFIKNTQQQQQQQQQQ